jgi:peptidoglycan lytic transglycosylase
LAIRVVLVATGVLAIGLLVALLSTGGRETRQPRLHTAVASTYHLKGGRLACGGRLRGDRLGVAHKTLPCGTRVTLQYGGEGLTVPVIDRGPFVAGRDFDLTVATARRLDFTGVHTIRWRLVAIGPGRKPG